MVGQAAAVAGLASMEDKTEKIELDSVKRKLSEELDYEALLQEDQELELALLELELLHLQEQEQQVIEQSAKPDSEVPPSTPVAATPPGKALGHPDTLPTKNDTANALPEPAVSVPKDCGDDECVKPPLKKLKSGKKAFVDEKDQLPVLSPTTKAKYQSWWSRHVATPQNHVHGAPVVAAKSTAELQSNLNAKFIIFFEPVFAKCLTATLTKRIQRVCLTKRIQRVYLYVAHPRY